MARHDITTEGIEAYIEYLEYRIDELKKDEDVKRWSQLVDERLEECLSMDEDKPSERFEELDKEILRMQERIPVRMYRNIADMAIEARTVMMSMEDARMGLI